jgi:hypothetical protein
VERTLMVSRLTTAWRKWWGGEGCQRGFGIDAALQMSLQDSRGGCLLARRGCTYRRGMRAVSNVRRERSIPASSLKPTSMVWIGQHMGHCGITRRADHTGMPKSQDWAQCFRSFLVSSATGPRRLRRRSCRSNDVPIPWPTHL